MRDTIQHDSPWKEALDRFLRPFLELAFPEVACRICWAVDPIPLEQEFREIAHDAELGPLRADKLVKVRLLDGTDQWLLIHIEVQMHYDPDLLRWLFDYCCRIHSRFRFPVFSLAVLGDTRPTWRPDRCIGGFADHGLTLRFAVCKLSDFEGRLDEPAHRDNQTIIVIAAHLGTRRHHRHPERLSDCRLELTRKLHSLGHATEDLRSLMLLIDWLMPLPAEHKVPFRKKLEELKKEKPMPHITLYEEFAREEGREQGREQGREAATVETLQESIAEVLATRFGEVPGAIRERIGSLVDKQRLKELHRRAILVPKLEEF